MRIDAHHHLWTIARGDYGWLTPDLPICRDYRASDIAPLLAAAGIDRTILVQAAPSEAETDFLLDIAAAEPFVAGVVGWIDFDAPDAAVRVERAAAAPGLVGLRPMVQDIADDDWLLRPSLRPVWQAMAACELAFDALVKPQQLPTLHAFLDRYPDLRVVVDHGAKPDIAARRWEPWAGAMRAIARDTAACCKLSGLATEAAPGWVAEDLRPYADLLLDGFGPARLMWGSDWPVLDLNGDYRRWVAASDALLAGCDPDACARIHGGTATRFYRL